MISVCMATYNGEKYLKDQIVSILDQISAHDELIISDDGSTDNTLGIVIGLKDERIKIVSNALQHGYSGNFENAINSAVGDIIFLSDQDDVWFDGKVNKMVCLLDRSQLVVSDAQFVDKDLNLINKTYFSLRDGRRGFFSNLYKLRYIGACMAFRREVLSKVLPFPNRKDLCPHDMWIALVSEFYFNVTLIKEPLIYYRRHGHNASNGGTDSSNSLLKKIIFRGYSLMMVISRMKK